VQEIEDTEVIQAAKFIHWVQNDPAHRQTQIEIGVAHFKDKMAKYADQYSLNGADDASCLVVADIHHQGRAKSPAIMSALQTSQPLAALLAVGEPQYHDRLVVLRREIKNLTAEGRLGTHKYSTAKKDFVAQ
jgi:hypothetical protein